MKYRAVLAKRTSSIKTGGNVNTAVFRSLLGSFAQYYTSKMKKDDKATPLDVTTAMMAPPEMMTLGEFKVWAAAIRMKI